MGTLSYLIYPVGLLLEILAIVHFIRRQPSTYWIWIIVFLGPFGSLIYLLVVAPHDFAILSPSVSGLPRRLRIEHLEASILDNPSAEYLEELGNLYMEEGNLASARSAFDKAIAARSDSLDSFYRRGHCALQLGDPAAAVPDLERVVKEEPSYDFHRAAGLLARACAKAGQKEKAEVLFRHATEVSTLSETYLNFADFLASHGRHAEAREWAQKVLDKERTMPTYLRRHERPWFQTATELLKRLPA
jgi:hypothetical protein